MKKYLIVWVVLFCAVLSFSSCKKEIKNVEGVVTSIESNQSGDSVLSMKVLFDGDTLLFSLKDAQYDNGMMIKDDAVRVHYIDGNGDTLRAVLVFVKPKPSKVIELHSDTTETLLTR